MHDEHTRIDPQGPSGSAWRPTRLTVALAGAAGFLVGVLLVAALGGTPTTTVTETQTARVTVTAPRTTVPGGTVITVTAVPPLVGEPLDVALARLDESQFEADVDGGGLFGVVDESNWTVVAQDPAPGTELRQGSTVRVGIERR